MIRIRTLPFLCLSLIGLSACTVQLGPRWDQSSAIEVGVVKAIATERRESLPPTAELGGLPGVANITEAGRSQTFINKMLPDTMQVYTITDRKGRTTYFASEKTHIGVGDCVAIERGPSSNLRRVGDRYCEGKSNAKPSELQTAANQCMLAKRQLMLAQSDSQLTAANRQVQTLCQFGG